MGFRGISCILIQAQLYIIFVGKIAENGLEETTRDRLDQ